MLSPNSWVDRAKALPLGGRARVDHDCGGGRTLTIKHELEGLSAYCFRCNDRGWVPPEPVPLSVRLERIRTAQEADNRVALGVALPEPAVRVWADWPADCRLWLLKAGLCSADLPRLGAYYHPPTNRVVLPVFGPSGGVLFWQARAVDKRLPKYLSPAVGKTGVVATYGRAEDITVTEDLLSSYKVSLSGGEGWCLMGTSLNKGAMAKVLASRKRVNLWLDPDDGGRKGVRNIAPALRAAGVTVRIINSKKDPKLLPRAVIKEMLLWN